MTQSIAQTPINGEEDNMSKKYDVIVVGAGGPLFAPLVLLGIQMHFSSNAQ